MAFNISQLVRSTGYLNFNGANLFTRKDFKVQRAPSWERILVSNYGPVDNWKKNNVLRLSFPLWGAYEDLAVLFPPQLTDPLPGTSLFGGGPLPVTVVARNNDLVTYPSAQITKLGNLYLGTNEPIWEADIELTILLPSGVTPETAGAYEVIGTQAYSDAVAAFSEGNFKQVRYTSAWGSFAGFTSFIAQKGIHLSWEHVGLTPHEVDGYGTVDFDIESTIAQSRFIPIGPTMAQVKAQSNEESPMGTLASSISGTLVHTGLNGPVITLNQAFMKSSETNWSKSEHRVGETVFETTRALPGGVPQPVVTLA